MKTQIKTLTTNTPCNTKKNTFAKLASCRFCDQIAVFDHGEIIQRGTHSQLLSEEEGKYAELWQAQAQYYTEDIQAAG